MYQLLTRTGRRRPLTWKDIGVPAAVNKQARYVTLKAVVAAWRKLPDRTNVMIAEVDDKGRLIREVSPTAMV
jgi:hypothetical protein